MTVHKAEVRMPDSGLSEWIIYLPLDESNPDKMGAIELSYSSELNVPTAVLITEDANEFAYYDDMEYTLIHYDAETDVQIGAFTVRPSLYRTIELTVLVVQKQNYISIEIKREVRDGDHTEDDADLQFE